MVSTGYSIWKAVSLVPDQIGNSQILAPPCIFLCVRLAYGTVPAPPDPYMY